MKRVVQIVELLALGCALVFVVMLFANEPDDVETDTGDEPAEATDSGPEDIDGAAIFGERCASCHGATGGGGRGPQLSDGQAVERFPELEDQIAVVANGRGGMPSFEGRLNAEELQAVVEYTRTL